VGKAQHLIQANGGTSWQEFDLSEKMAIDDSRHKCTIPGVNYSEPIVITFLKTYDEPDNVFEKTDDLLAAIERVRESAAKNQIAMMVDSTSKSATDNEFTGCTIAVRRCRFTNSTEVLKSLNRLGVSFAGVFKPLHSFSNALLDTEFGFERESARLFRPAGIRLLISAEAPEKINNLMAKSEIWGKQILYRLSVSMFKANEAKAIAEAGCFILLYRSPKASAPDWKQAAVEIKKAVDEKNAAGLGIEVIPELIEEMVKLGVEDKDIEALMQNNLQRTLARWWADSSYTKVE